MDCFDEETRLRRCAEEFKNKLDLLNKVVTDKVNKKFASSGREFPGGHTIFQSAA